MTEAGFFEKVQNQHLVAAAAADRVRWVVEFLTRGKCFTYVTKTTYSRKLENYNGTIIFEFDIMKNSSPLNLKVTFFATVKTK